MVRRIGVDIGDTFTDVAVVEEASGRTGVAKHSGSGLHYRRERRWSRRPVAKAASEEGLGPPTSTA